MQFIYIFLKKQMHMVYISFLKFYFNTLWVPVHNVSDEATVRGGGAGMDTVPGTT